MDAQVRQEGRGIVVHSKHTDFLFRLLIGLLADIVILSLLGRSIFTAIPLFLTAFAIASSLEDVSLPIAVGSFMTFLWLYQVSLAIICIWGTYILIRDRILQHPSLEIDEQGIVIGGDPVIARVSLAWHEVAVLEVKKSRWTRNVSFSVYPKDINLFLSRYSRRRRFFRNVLTAGSLSFKILLRSPGIEIGTRIHEVFDDKLSEYQIQMRENRRQR